MFFVFKHKTAYEMRISDWSSDVCSSDLVWERAVAATVDRSLMRGFGSDLTIGASRGCLALRTSMGQQPLLHEGESSPDLQARSQTAAPELWRMRRCPPVAVAPLSDRSGGVGEGRDEAEGIAGDGRDPPRGPLGAGGGA